MKTLLFALAIIIASCNNHKAEIVEQIKSYKDSLAGISSQQLDLTIEISKVQEKYIGQQAIDSVYALESRQSPLKAELLVKQFNYQSRIDSLELELKKY